MLRRKIKKIQLSDHFTYERLIRFVLPSIAMMIFTSIYGVIDGFFVSNFAGKTAFAAVNLIMPFPMIVGTFGFMMGTGGSAPIVGYHYGAQNKDEMHNVLQKSLILMAIFGVSMTVLAFVLSGPMCSLYVGYDLELFEMTKLGFKLYSLSFLIMGFNNYASSFFTALGNGAVSAGISFLRTLLFQIGAILILPIFLGLNGIWLSIVAVEILALFVSIYFFKHMQSKYKY